MNEVKLLNIGGIDQNVKDQFARDIIATSENGLDSSTNLPVSSRHYNAGEYLIGQDRLFYKALVEINVGDTLVVGTNITPTTVAEELNILGNQSAESALEAIAYVENDILSTRAYSIGNYLYWNYGLSAGLYKVIAAISASDALVVDTNIELAPNIESQIVTLTNNDNAMLNVLGAKNILPNKAVTQVSGGITFTVNSDGSITINGTRNASSALILLNNVAIETLDIKQNETYILSGATEHCYVVVEFYDSSSTLLIDARIIGEDIKSFTVPSRTAYVRAFVAPSPAGVTVSNEILYPMIRPASIADDTYVPYAPTNRNCAEKTDLTSISETGTTASQAIAQGTYFYLNGGLVRSKVAIAQGATFTLNTNYEIVTAGALNGLTKVVKIAHVRLDNQTIQGHWYTNINVSSYVPSGYSLIGLSYLNIWGHSERCSGCLTNSTTLGIQNYGDTFTDTVIVGLLVIKTYMKE